MSELENLRKRIDDLDSELIRVLAERFAVTKEIGYLKATNGIAERDLERERVQTEQIDALSHEVGLNPKMTQAVFAAIIDQVLKEHREMKEERPGSH